MRDERVVRWTRGGWPETIRPELQVRALIYSQLWQRDDPITQLPPGVTSEKSYTVTTGIEQYRARANCLNPSA